MSATIKNSENEESVELKGLLGRDFEEIYRETKVNDDTRCGYSILSGWLLQK